MGSPELKKSVFANGIWKSGNNLLLKLCGFLGVQVSGFGIATSTLIGDHYIARRIMRGPGWQKSPISVGLDMPVNVSKKWVEKKIIAHKNSCIGGHSAYSKQLEELLIINDYRLINIVRDPRDVIVSFAHWIEKRPDYYAYPAFKNLGVDEKAIKLITGFQYNDMYFDSFATILDRSYGWLTNERDILVVRFEDLVGELGGGSKERQMRSVYDVAKWIGCKNVDAGDVCDRLFGKTPTFRKGLIGAWREEMSEEVKELFVEKVGDRLQSWGYD